MFSARYWIGSTVAFHQREWGAREIRTFEAEDCNHMELPSSSAARFQSGSAETVVRNEAHTSGVSWAAVVAGAFVAAALSLALLALGTGIGFSAVSPWANAAASVATIGWTAIVWLVLTQLIAASVGGYLAGRLRTKWVNIHSHEVYFRDTAHGFLVWAVGLVITAAFLTSAATSMIGGAARASVTREEALGPAGSQEGLGPNGYLVNMLLRRSASGSDQDSASVRAEVGLILGHGLREGSLPAADRLYLARVVAAKTGAGEADAERRVDDAYVQARQAADGARKALAHSMYWTFLALLVGAFCASLAATIGGKERDRVVVI
jgi:hypothetical protein